MQTHYRRQEPETIAAEAANWVEIDRLYKLLKFGTPAASAALTPAHCRLATVSGGAMFYSSDVDLSPQAGTDAGSTAYLLVLYDNTGALVTAGHMGAVGGGEGLSGIELVANGTFGTNTVGWTPYQSTLASVAGGASGNCLELTRTIGSSNQAVSTSFFLLTTGALYKTGGSVKSGTAGNVPVHIKLFQSAGNAYIAVKQSTSSDIWSDLVCYGTCTNGAGGGKVEVSKNNSADGTVLFDTVFTQRVTDLPATGVNLHSLPNGTDRKVILTGSGNPNSVSSYKIYYIGS